MNDTTPKNVTAYLTELENELAGIAPDVRHDILAGVREELLGLDPAAASARIDTNDISGFCFTDFFNLLKVEGKWTVISKIYHTHVTP